MGTRSSLALVGLEILALVLPLGGCALPPKAREEATKRWNTARAKIKVRLAADQLEAGNMAAAAGELTEAQELTPNDPDFVPLRARILLADGRVNDAADVLRNAPADSPRRAEIEYLRGVVAQQQQRWEEALTAFQQAAALDPHEVAYVVAVAQTELQIGQPAEALAVLRAAEERFAWTGAYQAALAECAEQSGDWPAAVAAWQRASDSPLGAAYIQQRLAVALYRAGRMTEALDLLREIVAADDAAPSSVRLMLAECYLAAGQVMAARYG